MKNNLKKYFGDYFDNVYKKLLEKNFIIEKEELKPYEDMTPSGKKRVVKIVKLKNNRLKIIWSYENYN